MKDDFVPIPQQCQQPQGGGGGSSSTSSSTESSTVQNIDRRQVVAEGGVGLASDGATTVSYNPSTSTTTNSVTTLTDYGSVAGAVDLAKTSTAGVLALAQANTAEVTKQISGVLAIVKQAGDLFQAEGGQISEAYKTSSEIATGQKFLIAGGLVIAGIVAVGTLKKGHA